MPKESNPSTAPVAPAQSADEFDYVIVGAGSSGCVIANRLTEDKDISVLLLEAGGPEPDPRMDQFLLTGSKFDWKYQTEPEPQLDNRRIPWPRGKVLGGSGVISGLVCLRGNRLDYDHWESLGNEGWAYDDVLPYFRKSETNTDFNDEFHGDHGPLSIQLASDNSGLKQAFFEAAETCGFKSDPLWDFNGATQEGVAGIYQKTFKHGRRHSVGAAFLAPILERPNLKTRPFSLATRLVWDNNRAVGVEYVSNEWDSYTAHARREVIVCAGAVDSPRLLMLSGIGPAEHLRSHRIPIKADLAGVGQNLQDHPNVTMIFKPNANAGVVSDRVGAGGLFVSTGNGLPYPSPDLQLYLIEVVVTQEGFGFKPGPLYFCTPCLVRPQSTGSISLRSVDPLAAPVIRANYLANERDLKVLTDGVELVRRLASSGPLSRMLDSELMPGPDCRTTQQIEGFVRQSASTNFHPVGTCKMGQDAMAVVDSQLRVHGVDGLRVADASIMPTIVNANTIAPCVMIGEKAAAMIRNTDG